MSHAAHPLVPVSFELSPARRGADACAVARAASVLAAAEPAFVSVRSGVPGVGDDRSLALLRHVRESAGVRAVAHITCAGSARAELVARIDAHLDAGVRDFLALRGDASAHGASGGAAKGPAELTRLLYATAAARGIRITVGSAAYPQGHRGAHDSGGDLSALLAKEEAGATFALTQIVFDAASYAGYVARARRAGVTIPIIPGIMPIASPARLRRVAALTGVPAPVPQALELEQESDPHGWRRLGVARATRLARDLVREGAPGLHLYTLNRPEIVLDVVAAFRAGVGMTDTRAELPIMPAAPADDRVVLVA